VLAPEFLDFIEDVLARAQDECVKHFLLMGRCFLFSSEMTGDSLRPFGPSLETEQEADSILNALCGVSESQVEVSG
jgi:hypothetical protein